MIGVYSSMMRIILGLGIGIAIGGGALAQGTVAFANAGHGMISPLVNDDEALFGSGWYVQLQFANGTNIGEPAPIIGNGLFSDGVRVVPGVPGGQTVDLQLFVYNPSSGSSGVYSEFSMTLGGAGDPPGPPSALAGLNCWPCPRPAGWLSAPSSAPRVIAFQVFPEYIELQWPSEYSLFASNRLGESGMTLPGTVDGSFRTLRQPTSGPQMFFWLE